MKRGVTPDEPMWAAVSVTMTFDEGLPDEDAVIVNGAWLPGFTPDPPEALTCSHSVTPLGDAEGDAVEVGDDEGAGDGEAPGVPVAHPLPELALLFATVRAVVVRMAASANRQPAMIFAPAPCARMVIRPIPFVRLLVYAPSLARFVTL